MWQPIETAPKDGSDFVMLDAKVGTATVGKWMADVDWINEGKKDGEWMAVPGWFPLLAPTHWMPLPDLPTPT